MCMFVAASSTFLNNDGRRGSVFVIGNVVTVNGTSHFEGNIGPVLRVSLKSAICSICK